MESASLTNDTQRQWFVKNDARAQKALRSFGVDYRLNEARPPLPFAKTSLRFIAALRGPAVPIPLPPLSFPRPTMGQIKALVAKVTGVPILDMDSQRRDRPTAEARQVAMYLARKHTHLSLPQIAGKLGRKDHSTVLHGVRKVERHRERFGKVIADVEAKLHA